MRRDVLLLTLLATAMPLNAAVALLVGEPYGRFGFFNPTGHAAVYLSRVCADSPLRLRPCREGELGAVISRYNRIGGYDWLAIPLVPYLYAVDRLEDVPEAVDRETVARLRDAWRRRHLRDIVPDAPDGGMPAGDWVQLVGAAYDRTLYGLALETTPEDDERLIEFLNGQPNERRFNIFARNCADFAKDLIHFYYPGAIRRNVVADFGITTPKQAARSLVRFAHRSGSGASHFVVPQVPGAPASRPVRGVNESLVRSKKYLLPLVLVQPWVAAGAATAYLTTGRFDPRSVAQFECRPEHLPGCVFALRRAHQAQDLTAGAPAEPLASDGG